LRAYPQTIITIERSQRTRAATFPIADVTRFDFFRLRARVKEFEAG